MSVRRRIHLDEVNPYVINIDRTPINNRKRFEVGGSGMSQNEVYKLSDNLVVTPKANMTRSQYNYSSAYNGDAMKGIIKAIPGIGDAANLVELVHQYYTGDENADENAAKTAALKGLSTVKVRGIPVGKFLTRGYSTITNLFK